VHPTSGSLRVFQAFFWLWAFRRFDGDSTPAQPPVTRAVGLSKQNKGNEKSENHQQNSNPFRSDYSNLGIL
jgi:hypothetical protein